MKSLLQSLFEALESRVLVVHNAERRDRARAMTLWTEQHGVQVARFDAIMIPNDGRKGCALSHQRVAEFALSTKEGALKPYLVLEDDAMPTRTAYQAESMLHLLEAIDSKEFDILYLGGLPLLGHSPTAWSTIRKGSSLQTHAMIVFPAAAQWLSKFQYKGDPIDVELARANLRTGFLHPQLFDQYESHSDIRRAAISQTSFFSRLLVQYITPCWRHVVVHQLSYALVVFAVVMRVLLAS
jgi:hypothetical protein